MTTPRTRRSKPQQAVDILRNLLPIQDAKAEKLHLLWAEAMEEADRTRRALELLPMPIGKGGTGDDFSQPPNSMTEGTTADPSNVLIVGDMGVNSLPIRPHRQRIGEKAPRRQGSGGQAQGINDVWASTSGETVLRVHSELMYARQDLCELCKAGVPFATEERVVHYVTTVGPEYGYYPCRGVKE